VTHTPTTNIPSFLPHRRYARLNARTAVLGVKGYFIWIFRLMASQRQIFGIVRSMGKPTLFHLPKIFAVGDGEGVWAFLTKKPLESSEK
jgi:hypothetical protein